MYRLFFALLAACLALSFAATGHAQVMEKSTNRPGATYKIVPVGQFGPERCWTMCSWERNCKAWSWQRPGISGPNAVCRLKTDVMPGHDNPGYVSGISSHLEDKVGLPFANRQRDLNAPYSPAGYSRSPYSGAMPQGNGRPVVYNNGQLLGY